MARLTDREWEHLARDLARRVEVVAPGWTDHNESDPGVTLAELMAFLAESLLTRPEPSRRAAITRLRDVVNRLERATMSPCRELSPLTRLRYFHGRLLSPDDLALEQRYVRDKQRRHNLLLHGVGIVQGLEVTVEPGPGDAPVIAVSPGVAVGPDGEELVVCERITSNIAAGQSPSLVILRLVDRPGAVVPAPDGEEASRIEEVVELHVLHEPRPGDAVIGRVEQVDGAWRLDPEFKRQRLGSHG
jgi:hypothetical protein